MKLITFQYGPTGQLNKDYSSTQMDYLDCTYDFWNCTFLIIKPLLNLIFKIKLSISRIIRSFIYEFLNLFGVLFYHWMVIRFHGVVKLCRRKIHLCRIRMCSTFKLTSRNMWRYRCGKCRVVSVRRRSRTRRTPSHWDELKYRFADQVEMCWCDHLISKLLKICTKFKHKICIKIVAQNLLYTLI